MRDANSKMPPDIGHAYDALDRELSWYHRTLSALYDLYLDKPQNVEMFNDLAPDFFGFIQRALVDSLVVLLSRITDAESISGHANLSFKRLVSLIDATLYPTLSKNVQDGLAELELLSTSARKHRNKRVAHCDLATAMATEPLPDILLTDFKNALKTSRDLLNAVARNFDGFEVSHQVAPAPGGTGSLLLALTRAREAKSQNSFRYFMGFDKGSPPTQGQT